MRPKSSNAKSPTKAPSERVVKDIRRRPRRQFSAEDQIRIVLEDLRGNDSIALQTFRFHTRVYDRSADPPSCIERSCS